MRWQRGLQGLSGAGLRRLTSFFEFRGKWLISYSGESEEGEDSFGFVALRIFAVVLRARTVSA